MDNYIKVNKDILNKIKYDNVIAIFLAEGGAMGEPNAFHAILNDLTHYYTNLGEIDFTREEFFKALPVMGSFNCFCEQIMGLEDGWKWYNAGFGNYLIVRNDYTDKVDKYIKEHFKDNWEHGELYQNWYDMIKEIV
ncbi:MAG TPA: hypothetical protein PLV83_03310 [Bacilli bacterium]|nr:hypothetical protein [Bacilli bacterium]